MPETKTKEIFLLFLTAISICILSYLAIYRFSTFDKEFHLPLALTIFHNNVYPPRDIYKPEYVLLYHFGGDLLAGAINYICRLDISRCYELISSVLSGTTFLGFFALAWVLTKNFKLSYISGFCTYFGGGLLWLDAIIRYLSKNLPENGSNWGFFQTFINIGIHGGIIDAPSINTFLATMGLGNPLLIFSLFLFWKIIKKNKSEIYLSHLVIINISLFVLFLSAEWMYVTFWAGAIPFLLILLLKKQFRVFPQSIAIFLVSILLTKTIGNALFLQDPVQSLGRANIFEIGLKEKLFTVISWGRLTEQLMNYQALSCFSWDFISEFGLSLIFFPVAIFYLIKSKNKFAFLLFLTALTTMPVPTIIEFKLNPVDFNRLFNFGNTMLVLLITCGMGTLFRFFLEKKILIGIYLFVFCFSPLSGLISSIIFTPHIFSSKTFVQDVFNGIKMIKSPAEFKIFFTQLDLAAKKVKNTPRGDYKKEIEFLKTHSKPKDVAISSVTDIPVYAGIYSIIPAGKWLYKDLLYSPYDSIFLTALTTLDPYILNELNIKWLLISNNSRNNLPDEAKEILHKSGYFTLEYEGPEKNTSKTNWYEIYHINIKPTYKKNYTRKTAWLLVNEHGQPIELSILQGNKITLFANSREALLYLRDLHKTIPQVKKQLITAQATSINLLQMQIEESRRSIFLNKRF